MSCSCFQLRATDERALCTTVEFKLSSFQDHYMKVLIDLSSLWLFVEKCLLDVQCTHNMRIASCEACKRKSVDGQKCLIIHSKYSTPDTSHVQRYLDCVNQQYETMFGSQEYSKERHDG